MKKILSTISILLLSLIIVSCSPGNDKNKDNGDSETVDIKSTEKETVAEKNNEETEIETMEETEDNTDQNDDSQATKLFDEIYEKNMALDSLTIDVNFEMQVSDQDGPSGFKVYADYIYSKDKEYKKIKGKMSAFETDGSSTSKDVVLIKDENQAGMYNLYYGSEDEGMQHETSDDGRFTPNFRVALDDLKDLEEDLKLEEKDGKYIFTLENQETDLMPYMVNAYDLTLNKVTQSDFNKNFEVTVNKDDLLIENIYSEFDGKEGIPLKIVSEFKVTNHNAINEEDIVAPE